MKGRWEFVEPPKAYTWDPETERFFRSLDIHCEQKESFYTSIHYVVKERKEDKFTCEIQVRTLFEEIWGEIDHSINYPNPIDSVACREQLRVLSKLVSTGTKLADSIFRTYNDYVQNIDTDSNGNVENERNIASSYTPKLVRQYIVKGNTNWFENIVNDPKGQVAFIWPNGYWPFEKLSKIEKPVEGDYFAVSYGGGQNDVIVGAIKYAGMKPLSDVTDNNKGIPNKINTGFSNSELMKFVNNRREVGYMVFDNIRVLSCEQFEKEFEEYLEKRSDKKNKIVVNPKNLLIFKKN
jgi:hypothetical protein